MLFSDSAVFGHVTPSLPHKPDWRAVDRLTLAGAAEVRIRSRHELLNLASLAEICCERVLSEFTTENAEKTWACRIGIWDAKPWYARPWLPWCCVFAARPGRSKEHPSPRLFIGMFCPSCKTTVRHAIVPARLHRFRWSHTNKPIRGSQQLPMRSK